MFGRWTSQVVTHMVFALALLVAGALAPLSAAAQTAPVVSFTPSSVAVGGTLSTSGSGFACERAVSLDLVDLIYPGLVAAHLTRVAGEPFVPCASWSGEIFRLPATVTPGQYRVRATDNPTDPFATGAHTAVSPSSSPLTVTSPGVTITGVAQCSGDGTFNLPGAIVQLLSGSDIVASGRASSTDASYSFTGAASQSIYGLRYFNPSSEGAPATYVCGTSVTTNTNPTTVGTPPPCPNPERQNHAWDAAGLQPNGGAVLTSGVSKTDFICRPNQSDWFKITINPGSTISLSVTGAGPKTRVSLFKDLRGEGNTLLGLIQSGAPPLNLRQLTTSMSGVGGTDWDSADWDSADWDSAPWASVDWDSADWDSADWDSADWDSAPALATDRSIYSAAQRRSLLAFSKHGQIVRNTWDNSGDFYIRVFNSDASFDPTQALTITATVGPVCGTGSFNQNTTPPAASGNPTTLILTNTARLKGANGLPVTDVSNFAAYTTALQNFVTAVQSEGLGQVQVLDFGNDATLPGLRADYTQWDAEPSCVPAANLVSEGIHGLLAKYRAQPNSALRYVMIVGGHTVIPYRLLPDYAEIQREKRYDPGLTDLSESKATLASNYVMSDNYYVDFTEISRPNGSINVPEANLAIGRVVENSDDFNSVAQTYADNNGVLTPATALAAGYSFISDLAAFEKGEFQRSGLTTESGVDAQHPEPGLLIGDSWTMTDLRNRLFADAARFDILALDWHAATNVAVAADYNTDHPSILRSAELDSLPATDTRFRNTLVMSIGCHFGYNLVDGDVLGVLQGHPVTNQRDFTQVLASRGAMVLGSTGYGYGDTLGDATSPVGYTERLLASVVQELEFFDQGTTPQPVPVGLALTRAKRNYVDGASGLTGVDRKSVEELTFYGPPMWSIALPTRTLRPTRGTLGFDTVSRGNGGLSVGDVTPPYTLTQQSVIQGDVTTRYYSSDGGNVANNGGTNALPFRPILPFKGPDISANGVSTQSTARGVALLAADYQDISGFNPTLSAPATEVDTARPSRPTGGFFPPLPVGMNELVGQSLALAPFQFSGSNGTARVYSNSGLSVRTYFSNAGGEAGLAGPATIGDVTLTADGTVVHVDATISGALVPDLADVLLTYTAVGANSLNGHWRTCNLIPGRTSGAGNTASCANARFTSDTSNPNAFFRHYLADLDTTGTGAAPKDLRVLIQAVTGTGLISVRTNDGQYFQVVPRTATIASPKNATALTLTPPSNPTAYDHRVSFTARLTTPGNSNIQLGGRTIQFRVGSQQKRAQTGPDGSATVSLIMQELPNAYQVIASFDETPDLLASKATTGLTVRKKGTSLTPGATPYLVTLRDEDGQALREQTVYFTFDDGAGVVQTVAALTTGNGVAQLGGFSVPAGSYTLTARFLGLIPLGNGQSTTITDDRYSESSTATGSNVVPDVTQPSCDLTFVDPNGSYIQVTVQDLESGLQSIGVTEANNVTIDPFTYSAGLQTPVVITARKVIAGQPSQLGLEVTDVAGNVTRCDPIAVQVGGSGESHSVTVHNVRQTEHFVSIYNGRPGLRRLRVTVNNRVYQIHHLGPGEVRTLDIAGALHGGIDNTVTLTAIGSANGTALVLISDVVPPSARFGTRDHSNPREGVEDDGQHEDQDDR